MRRFLVGGLALLMMSACSSDASDSTSAVVTTTVAPATTTVVEPPFSLDQAEPPVVATYGHCYGECEATSPTGWPGIAVYRDGTVLTSSFWTGPGLEVFAGAITAADVDALLDSARAAHEAGALLNCGVSDGGPVTYRIIDGSSDVSWDVWCLESRLESHPMNPIVAANGAMSELLATARERADTEIPITTWLVYAGSTGSSSAVQPWTGPDPATIAVPGCTLVEAEDWPLTMQETLGFPTQLGDQVVVIDRRPLLPHETGCPWILSEVTTG